MSYPFFKNDWGNQREQSQRYSTEDNVMRIKQRRQLDWLLIIPILFDKEENG